MARRHEAAALVGAASKASSPTSDRPVPAGRAGVGWRRRIATTGASSWRCRSPAKREASEPARSVRRGDDLG